MENMIHLDKEQTNALVEEGLLRATTYKEYRTLVEAHVAAGTSTGPAQTEALANYTMLNHSRLKRGDKTVKISEEIQEKFKTLKGDYTWLVITESWCGDAAQTMPAMNKLAELSSKINLKVVLRDEHIELMNAFLTNGSMSIPKLIVWDNTTHEVTATWGPRPSTATHLVNNYKNEHGALTPQFKQDLQVWYNKDKYQTTLEDLAQLMD